jgi:hypothetical protein
MTFENLVLEPAFTSTPVVANLDSADWLLMTYYAAQAERAVDVTPVTLSKGKGQ